MADEITVRNWEKFQHRDVTKRGRAPAWIRLYTELLSDENYLALTPSRRSLLIGIWLEYARTRRELPDDTASLSRRLAQRVLRADLEALSHAGFIEIPSSQRQASVKALSSLEERREDKEQEQGSPTDVSLDVGEEPSTPPWRGLELNGHQTTVEAILANIRKPDEDIPF